MCYCVCSQLTEFHRVEVAGIDKEVCSEEITESSAGLERQRSVDMKCGRPVSIGAQRTTCT